MEAAFSEESKVCCLLKSKHRNSMKPSLALQAPTDLGYSKTSPSSAANHEQSQAAAQHISPQLHSHSKTQSKQQYSATQTVE